MDAVAVSLGGSFLVGEKGVDTQLTKQIAELLERASASRRILAVVGGGAVARTYIQGARALGAPETTLDEIGIAVTRINARILIAALPHAYPKPPLSFDEALLASRSYPIVVMGGTHPGHTTDAVTVMLGDAARAKRIVIATNVDGVYSADPRKDPNAKHLPRLSAEELVRICSMGDGKAGGTGVVDALGAKMIARSGIETAVVDGRDLKALEGAITGRTDFHGSLIQ
ncbi:MAG: uridylate kinase [Thermoplasmata archaeon]|jgi:uridylate kinase|nr:uridylate kinase [Thermoplasmata archaeon]